MTEQQMSGVDLARVALKAAMADAKNKPATKKPRRSAASSRRTGGREPMGFAAAIEQMMTERGWDLGAKGGSILDQWPTIAPELAGKVAAERFDEDTRTLHLRPVSPAYRTQLELYQRQIVDKVNETVGAGTVQQLKILAPGAVGAAPEPASVPDERSALGLTAVKPPAPRERNPRYLEALAAHKEHKRTRETAMDAYVRQATEQQNEALRRRRESEDAFTEALAQEELLKPTTPSGKPVRDSLEASIQAAIAAKYRGTSQPRRLSEAS